MYQLHIQWLEASIDIQMCLLLWTTASLVEILGIRRALW